MLTTRSVPPSHVIAELEGKLRRCQEFPAVISVPFRGPGILDWLASQPEDLKLFWAERDSSKVVAGWGIAQEVVRGNTESYSDVLARCRQQSVDHPRLRWFGGLEFQPRSGSQDDEWRDLGRGRFWLPRLVYNGRELQLTVVHRSDRSAALDALAQLRIDVPSLPPDLPDWLRRHDVPSRADWARHIEEALQLFREEALEKIVLVRRCTLDFAASVPVWPLLDGLRRVTRHAFCFCFCPAKGTAFLGASPERLFRRDHRRLLTEVIAGTRPRGPTQSLDARLGQELLASTKDQLEHAIVRKSIRQRLHCCVESMEVDDQATLLQLSSTQHLYSHVHAQLAPDIDDGMVIDRLHPTPALGGYPTENALAEIARLESYHRGWYGAPVGWVAADSAEFAVGIRSALVRGSQVHVYSGAGIVPGSRAEDEWEELDHKIRDLQQLLVQGSPALSLDTQVP